ncbi:hypothetical protein [Pseudoxanthomonas sp.]|uniref:hypothetical protein n=1 Tax=Pseudoxanthomonas sp. TaxID=1871049 RepID=UPI002585C6B6|nr:hypothetical protein [Pseudoxanthomonas sp.]MCR6686498.1 hypothetical protein [Pseudoxanthomonas sp.]
MVVFVAGLVFLVLACALLAQAPSPRTGTPALAGGCAPTTSPYLEADAAVRHAAISFCAGGDAATGRMSLYLPAGTLDRHRLVVAGYLDGEAVRAHVRREGAPPLAIVQRAAETWAPAEVAIPEAWRSVPLEVELVDAGEGHAQWGGLGLVAIAPTPAIERLDAILWLAAAAAFCLLAASPSRRQPYPAGAQGVLWRGGRALVIAGLAAAALLLGDAWYRNDAAEDWIHPDQEIPIKVMQAMHAHDDLNTDFARADIPGYFHEYRYNFSGYILMSYLTIRATAPEAFASDEDLHWLQARLAAGPALVLGGALGALFVLGLAVPLGVTDRLSGHFREDDLAAKGAEVEGRQRWAAHALGAVRTETLRFERVFQQRYPPTSGECVLHAGIAYNDDWSRRYYRHLPPDFRVYGKIASDFDDLPVSTLQPYHSPGIRLFYQPAACPGAIAPHPPSR